MKLSTENHVDLTDLKEIENNARMMRAQMMRSLVLSMGQWLRTRFHGHRAGELA